MGLTRSSIGKKITKKESKKPQNADYNIALAGNPNVGKSTVFNALTGMNQHTGNWPGKTVATASGCFKSRGKTFLVTDLPGTYSLMAHSPEEEIARDHICFDAPDIVAVVCDATCLERNLNLALQIIETGAKVIICVNLLDEAKRKSINIDTDALSKILSVPVIGIIGRQKRTLDSLIKEIEKIISSETSGPFKIKYPEYIEQKIEQIEKELENIDLITEIPFSGRFLALRIIEGDQDFISKISEKFPSHADGIKQLSEKEINNENIKDDIVSSIVRSAENIAESTVKKEKTKYRDSDRKADKILTGKAFGYPIMFALLLFIFWLTICGANYPSELLSTFLFYIEDRFADLFALLKIPNIITDALVHGMYRVTAWVVSVMLPPMAIFFPFFTLLEDIGYLPRLAYNLDKPFKCSGSCGKQALTMCMGFGCNAAGVVGCRIIDSPRERLLAILTNPFVPCNGRFPTLIAIISMFFVFGGSVLSSVSSALILTLFVLFGVLMTFAVTKILSRTVLRGEPSSFTLELPPYRRPQVGKVIVRSIFDRTLFLLGRSVAFAAPAGLVIWLMANLSVGDTSLLVFCSELLDPLGLALGLDGAILIAFILGLPANEIVIPIIIMVYLSSGTLNDISEISALRELFILNGWTWKTAVSMLIFTMFHWPCSTTIMTVKKETGSLKYTLLSVLLPSLCGIILCFLFNLIVNI